MKNKLRNITLGTKQFLYLVKTTYVSGVSSVVVKVFLLGYKTTPLVIQFTPLAWPVTGVALYTGTYLYNTATQQQQYVNINRPHLVTQCIVYALAKGWTGENQAMKLDGIEIMNKLHYNTAPLLEKK